ncbi:amylo-alpha-1,6-glucosidase [Cuniculiplasma sp. SKW4]|uniref:amylo-alpha-1,6-glucosidase n=1 Tax=Cuniculiplasma sp. SKW4 TaxID=3400171 RepID=UPI003FD48582
MSEKVRNFVSIGNDIEQLKSEGGWLYAGLPKFKSLFGRDSIISSLQLLDYDENIGLSTLKALSETQGENVINATYEEPGKIIHEIHEDTENIKTRMREVQWLKYGKNYFSVDSTPLYIILLSELMSRRKSLEGMYKNNLIRAMKWILDYGIIDTYLSYNKPIEGSGPLSMSWRDGIGEVLNQVVSPVSVIGVQSYVYNSLNLGLKFLEKYNLEYELRERTKMVLSRLRERTFLDFTTDDGVYPGIAIGGDGVLTNCITSEPGHLIFSGILKREEERVIIERLFAEDILTSYGIRTMSTKDSHFDAKAYQRGSVWPNDNWIIAYGLKNRGYSKEFSEIRNRMVECAEFLNGLPEFIGVTKDDKIIDGKSMRINPCFPQAWSAGAEYYFLRH